jgi:L-cysteine S-thiosulfotransferase
MAHSHCAGSEGKLRHAAWGRAVFALGCLAFAGLGIGPGALNAQMADLEALEVDGRKSGYLYMSEGVQQLQDDDFLNPGMLAVKQGRTIWNRGDGEDGASCASCHEDAAEALRGVASRYPVYDEDLGRLVNLPQRINLERETRMGAVPLPYESEDLLALTAFVANQSRGMPLEVDITGEARPYFERGREMFNTRMGQLNLACTHCHDGLTGQKLRGDVISQGQVNGFPIHRLMWNSMASRHRMLEWCNTSLRAEPFEYGSEQYLELELYLAWRGRGLPLEAPAVRR